MVWSEHKKIDQDNSLSVNRQHDLSRLDAPATTTLATEAISPYARYSTRLNHRVPTTKQDRLETRIILADPTIQKYLKIRSISRGNNGIISKCLIKRTSGAAKNFLRYTNRQITDHEFLELVTFKKQDPLSETIESAVEDFGTEKPNNTYAVYANAIIGIFRDNHAPYLAQCQTTSNPKKKTVQRNTS